MTLGIGVATAGGFASVAAVLITAIKARNGNNGKYVREKICKERVKVFETQFNALNEKTDDIKETVDKLLDIQLNGKK